jgi:hypothetical protein
MKRKPKKPTEPFGYISFGKNGAVSKHIFELSHEKEDQEIGAVERFIGGLNQLSDYPNVNGFDKLPEADHDFTLDTSAGSITVQLTELVERDYAKPISKQEYNEGKCHDFIQKAPGMIPLAADNYWLQNCLRRAIERKLEKFYAKSDSETLWLVVFCTSTYLQTEYYVDGRLRVSAALTEARKYLQTLPNCVFDVIWYTNLLTRPVHIWPEGISREQQR